MPSVRPLLSRSSSLWGCLFTAGLAACSGSHESTVPSDASASDAVSDAATHPDAGGDGASPEAGCGATQKTCGGACVATTDPTTGCGGATCAACFVANGTAACASGACAVGSCSTGFADCNMNAADGCETNSGNDHEHCGTCTNACSATEVCQGGTCTSQCTGTTTDCNGSCVNIQGDPNHCDGCSTVCPVPADGVATCAAGKCGFICGGGYHACDSACSDDTSPLSCGTACVPCQAPANGTATCTTGQCGFTCNAGYVLCGTTCAAACGSTDGGTGTDASDGGASDGSALAPPGTQLTAGNDLTIWGVTTDGYVAYYDHTHATVAAVSIAGGAQQVISTSVGSNFTIATVGKAVLVWTSVDASGVGGLLLWTAADGAHTLSTASQSGYAALDGSSRYVTYTTNVNEAAGTCDLDGALTDGTEVATLVPGIEEAPNLFFGIVGSYAVVNYGQTVDGGLSTQVSSFAIGTWARADITTPAATWWGVQGLDAAGTEVLLIDPSNNLSVVPITGGAAVAIGPTGVNGLLTADGTAVLFGGAGGTDLDQSLVAAPAPVVLASGTGLDLVELSPDAQTVLLVSGSSPTSLYVASATKAGSLTTLAPVTNLGFFGYTSDSSHVLYMTDYDVASSNVGTLNSVAIAGGSPAVVDTGVFTFLPSGPTKIVFDDNLMTSTADLKVVDTASSAAPTVIVPQAHTGWALSPLGDQVVYSWSVDLGAAAGIYVTAVP